MLLDRLICWHKCRAVTGTAWGFTVNDAAQALGVTRKTLSEVLNGRAGVSPALALLAKVFGTSAEHWPAILRLVTGAKSRHIQHSRC